MLTFDELALLARENEPMTPTLLMLAGSFTLTAGEAGVTLTPEETCIAGTCVVTGGAKAAEDGTWRFDSGVRVKWTSHTEGTLSLDGDTWVAAQLTFATPSEPPPPDLEVRWHTPTTASMRRGAGPWTSASLQSPVAAASPWKGTPGERLTAGWTFTEGAEVVKCPGNVGGIWERKRDGPRDRASAPSRGSRP